MKKKKITQKKQVRVNSGSMKLLRMAQASLKNSPDVAGAILKVLAKKLRAESISANE